MVNLKLGAKSEQTFTIFISYRWDDTSGHVGRLYDVLTARFGDHVFRDINKIPAGEDFIKAIDDAVGNCKVVLVVMGNQWLSLKDAAGQRRLDDPKDFVRREIVWALDRKVVIIPVLVERASMPREQDLPDDLKSFLRRNPEVLSEKHWGPDVEQFVKVLETHVGPSRGKSVNTKWVAAALLTVGALVLAGSVGKSLMPNPEAKGTGAAASLSAAAPPTPSAAELKEQEDVREVLRRTGRCLNATDGMLQTLVSPSFDGRKLDKQARDNLITQIINIIRDWNTAKKEWSNAESDSNMLMSRRGAQAPWESVKKAVNVYVKCVDALNDERDPSEAPSDDPAVEKFQGCKREQTDAEDYLKILETTLTTPQK